MARYYIIEDRGEDGLRVAREFATKNVEAARALAEKWARDNAGGMEGGAKFLVAEVISEMEVAVGVKVSFANAKPRKIRKARAKKEKPPVGKLSSDDELHEGEEN